MACTLTQFIVNTCVVHPQFSELLDTNLKTYKDFGKKLKLSRGGIEVRIVCLLLSIMDKSSQCYDMIYCLKGFYSWTTVNMSSGIQFIIVSKHCYTVKSSVFNSEDYFVYIFAHAPVFLWLLGMGLHVTSQGLHDLVLSHTQNLIHTHLLYT